MLGGGVLDALLQPHQLHALVHHVDEQVGGQAFGAVGHPLDHIGVHQRGDAHGAALVVDLGVVVHHLKLADHVAELPQLPVPQPLGAVPVQHGDLVVGDLRHIAGEIPGLKGQQLRVGPRPEDHAAGDGPHKGRDQQGQGQEEGDGALLFQKGEVFLRPLGLEPGGQQGAAAVHRAQHQDKDIKIGRFQVDRRQLRIEIDQGHRQSDAQVDEHPGEGGADGPAGFLLPGRSVSLGGCAAVEALPVEAAGVCTGKSHGVVSFSDFRVGRPPAVRLRTAGAGRSLLVYPISPAVARGKGGFLHPRVCHTGKQRKS